jgi:excisionase family DNA binding protein
MDGLLTTSEAARRLGLSAMRVRQLMEAGRLTYVQTPYGRLIHADSVAEELARRQQQDRPRGKRRQGTEK